MKDDTFPPSSIKVPVEVWLKYNEDLKVLLGVYGVCVETSKLVDGGANYAFDLPVGWTRNLDAELRKFLDEFLH